MRLAAVLAVAAAALGLSPGPARAADECEGLLACIPVAGPWVVIPASSPGPSVSAWRLRCPEGVVGGVDARVSERAVAVAFPGLLGSPVNPGITTAESLVFSGTYTGRARRPTAFRPFIGCLPGGGGGRTPTALAQAPVKPGRPIVTRVKTLRLEPGRLARATHACGPRERLVRSSSAVGLYTGRLPTRAELAAVRVVHAVRGRRVLLSATRGSLPAAVRATVQIHAECVR